MIRRKLPDIPAVHGTHREVPDCIGSAVRTRRVSDWCLNGHQTPLAHEALDKLRAGRLTRPVPKTGDQSEQRRS